MASWAQKVDILRQNGLSDAEISEEEQRRRKILFDNGASGGEIDEYFGVKQFDKNNLKSHFDTELAKVRAEEAATTTGSGGGETESLLPKKGPTEADSFLKAVEAGFQMSVSGLLARQAAPDIVLSQNAGMAYRIASQIGTLAGDLPAMIAGGLGGGAAGGAAGSVVPVVGNVAGALVGGGAGSFALPTAMRKIMMDHYEKGDVQSFSDFWERASATFIEASKSALIGGATAGVGNVAGKVLAPIAGQSLTATGKTMSEIATMVSVGSALEGEMPEPSHFIEAAVVVGGLHGSLKTAKVLRTIFTDTGLKPGEASIKLEQDPAAKQEALSTNPDHAKINEALTGEKIPTTSEVEDATKLEPTKPLSDKPQEVFGNEAVEKIASQMGEAAKPAKPGLVDYLKSGQWYTDFVDRLNPIKQAVKLLSTDPKALLDINNPYSLARMVNDYKAKAKHIFEAGTLDAVSLKVNGKGFKEIIDPHRGNLKEFGAYLASDRALELHARGIKSGFDHQAATETVSFLKDKYAASAKELVEFQNRNLKMLLDIGIISDKLHFKMTAMNQRYVPFSRLLEIGDLNVKKGGLAGFLKGIGDSDAKIQNPLISIMENTEVITKLVETNRARLAMVKLAEEAPDQAVMEKQQTPTRVTEVSEAEMAKYFEENAIEQSPTNLEIFRKQQKYNLAENEFEVFRDGKREVWKTQDVELAKALNSMTNQGAQGMLIKVASAVTHIKKLGISLTPEFIARNFMRDQLTAQVFSKMGGWRLPVVDTIVAMGDIFKKNEHYYNWLKAGGAGGSFIEMRSLIEQNLGELNRQTGFIDAAKNLVSKPIHFIEAAARLTEEATRLAEHKRVAEGATSGAKLFEAGFASREVTVDFQRMGAKLAAFNAITAFQNVSIQGLDRTIRAVKDNPQGMVAGASMITGISVTLWTINHDEKWYQELPRWERDLFWHIKAGEVVYRFPKPQELGILFGSLPERVLEAFSSADSVTKPMKERALKDFSDTVYGLMVPSWIPDVLSTPLEQFTNKSFFTGNPIVPQRVEKNLPEYQYMEYTTQTAKAIGKLIGYVPGLRDIGSKETKLASPMVVENYIRSWTGTMGMYVLQLADKAQEGAGVTRKLVSGDSEGAWQGTRDLFSAALADVPVIKAFVSRYPSATTQSIRDFRERYAYNQSVYNSIKMLGKAGEAEEMQYVIAQHEGDMMRLSGINESISKMGQAIQIINQTKEYSKSDKRQMIDGIYYQMIEVARSGNDTIEQLEETIRERKKHSRMRLP